MWQEVLGCHTPPLLPWSSCMKLKWPSHKLGHLYLPVMSRNKKKTSSTTTPCQGSCCCHAPYPPPALPSARTNGTQTALAIATNIKCEMENGRGKRGGEKESWKNVKCATWKQMPVQSAGRQLDIEEEGVLPTQVVI